MAGPSVQPNKMEQMHCALLTWLIILPDQPWAQLLWAS